MSGQLFRTMRVCECCERGATPRRRQSGEPNILSFQIVMTYLGHRKTLQKAAPSIRICTDCLAIALAEPKLWERKQSRKLLAAIRERLSRGYSYLLEVDAFDQVTRPPSNLSGTLEGIE